MLHRLWMTILALGLTAPAAAFNHPTAPDPAMGVRDRPVAIDVLANDPGVTSRSVVVVAIKPAHGTAIVQGREIVYTPAPGFEGRDAFRYLVKTGRSTGTAEVTVEVGPPMLTLSGHVTEGGGGAVSVVSGRMRFMGTSPADGADSLGVSGFLADMVKLLGRRGPVALASVVGTFERLLNEAGSDTILTRDENPQVQLTRLSTALAYLLQDASGGADVDDEDTLAAALAALDTDVLLQMAAAIGLVADGSQALPAQVADTLALISDPEAYGAFVDAVYANDPDAFPQAIAATLADPAVVAMAAREDMVGEWFLSAASAPGTVRVGIVHGDRLVLDPDGGGRFADPTPAYASGVSWSFVDGEARATLVPPRVNEALVFRDGAMVRVVYALEQVDLVPLVDVGQGARHLVGVRKHMRETYPDPPVSEQLRVGFGSRLGYLGDVPGMAYLPEEFPAIHALPVHRPEIYGPGTAVSSLSAAGFALHHFEADGGGVLDDGQGFTWSLAGGRLGVTYDDGDVVEISRLHHDGRNGDALMADYALPGGESKALYSLGAVRDGSLVFTPMTLTGSWRSGFELSQTAHDAVEFHGFYLELEADGSGRQISLDPFGTSIRPLQWSLQDGTMVAKTVEGAGVRERHWVPVSRAGDRIYVLEHLWRDTDGDGPAPPMLLSERPNFYQLQEPPEGVGAVAPRQGSSGIRR